MMPEHDRQADSTSNTAEGPEARPDDRGPASVLLALQRSAGNAAVNALLQRRRRIQRTPLIESD